MKTRDLATKAPVTIAPDATLAEAGALMDSANVGALLVMDGERCAGIVTDRDIVVRAVARSLPAEARIDGVMTTEVVVIDADADVQDACRTLGKLGVRRLPVRDGTQVVGMVTVDDLLVRISLDVSELVQPIVGELAFGHHAVPVPAVP